jgi:single-stranded-DNA-specific exonuclease
MAEWKIATRKFDDIIDQLLFNRGIFENEKEVFFDPDFKKDLGDPFLLKNFSKAIDRIQIAIERKERIGIFADYDADGIPGAALLFRALKKIGIETTVYIPNRENGYGLSTEGIDYLIEKKCQLIITVDLGIRNFAEAKYCKQKNIDLIITDHHTPDDKIPEAFAVINPKVTGDKYPFKELAGCGVAYKLVQGLSKYYPKELNDSFMKWNLDLVAISTVCDVVPLSGENRVLAKYGMIVLKKTKNIGLQKLIEVAGIDKENIDAYIVGFQIGPRINAPGRMDHATKSFELLVTNDEKEALELANWLDKKNNSRQEAMGECEREALMKIEKEKLLENNLVITTGNWPKGVIGPTANRLAEKINRPVILFAEEEGDFVGSARSINCINILDLLESAKEYIYKFGGHMGAAGLTVKKDHFKKMYEKIIHFANSKIKPNDLIKKINIDAIVDSKELKLTLYEKIKKFEPFGFGNSKPIFMLEKITFENKKLVGREEEHLSFTAKKDNNFYKSIIFNHKKEIIIVENKLYDIVFNLNLDTWNGNRKLSLNVFDYKESK